MTRRRIRDIWLVLKDSVIAWDRDNCVRLGAALAFYTALSLAPLLIIIIALSSFGFGREAASGHLDNQIRGLVGTEGASFVQTLIENAYKSDSSILAAIFGVLTLLLGASGVFVQLRESLNAIWHVRENQLPTILAFLRARMLSFAMILGIGFLLLVSLLVSTVLGAFGSYISHSLPMFGGLMPLIDFAISFLGIAVAFGLIFKYLPDAIIEWKDIAVGAAATSMLFSTGKLAIGFYLGNSAIGSTFGAASSLVIIMLWVFYSSQIVLFGAQFTRYYSIRFGSGVRPGKNAVETNDGAIDANSTHHHTSPSHRRDSSRRVSPRASQQQRLTH